MKKISSYVINGDEIQCLSQIACTSLMFLRCQDPWSYDIFIAVKDSSVCVQVSMKGVARDYSFNITKINDMPPYNAYDFVMGLKDKVQESGSSLDCISLLADLIMIEDSPKPRFGIKISDIQLFEE